ncbi:MerR family transcriptional regulator [Aliiroseovarius sp. PTFE2010]|uniref:MerR family transcriptional regulator n=1 Tax=Aliiroseovarius sp. PTFE2010 TaxID=3417190 RepID=UPI003CFB3BB5
MTDELMTIRKMCDAFDVSARTLRFYESKELLSPIREGQKRLFTKRDRARLKLIQRGKRFGFSLEDIRQLLDLYHEDEQGFAQLSEVHAKGQERFAEMIAQHKELTAAIDELKRQLDWGAEQLAKMNGVQKAS